jgi:very-short-patch-repair endonuclease
VRACLPEPEVNFTLYRQDGTWRRRFDLSYPGIKLIVEYDGRQHAEDMRQWEGDIERREEFDDEGYRILIVTSKGIFVEPERTLHRIRRQLVLRGWGDVPPIQPRWKEHFAA